MGRSLPVLLPWGVTGFPFPGSQTRLREEPLCCRFAQHQEQSHRCPGARPTSASPVPTLSPAIYTDFNSIKVLKTPKPTTANTKHQSYPQVWQILEAMASLIEFEVSRQEEQIGASLQAYFRQELPEQQAAPSVLPSNLLLLRLESYSIWAI